MKKEIVILGGIIALVAIVGFVGTRYYRNSGATAPAPVVVNSGTTGADTGSAPAPQANSEYLVRDDSPSLGPADAKVTIVEFLDPECESCALFHPMVKNVVKENEGKVRLVLRYMPLHPNSMAAATFLEAAGEQGKFWEAQDYLFKMQPEWGTKHGHGPGVVQPDAKALLKKYAKDLGLDTAKMDAAAAGNKYAQKIERDRRDGEALGVRQTPTLFVNGVRLARLDDYALRALIVEELKK
ncbi:MAG: DsbA family protein [Acidobacteriota bacterium]|nr:DsbA family protein [Acidobacteriota bacterium]MDH3530658.1 DsbA family protein [Acidobacteriota bacterium]